MAIFIGIALAAGSGNILYGILAGIVWGLTVSFAWILYRPVLGVILLAGAVFLLILVVKRLRRPASPPPLQTSPPPLA